MKIEFTFFNKFVFYASYIYYKAASFVEVKSPRFNFFFFELLYSVNKILRIPVKINKLFSISYVETKFGKFHIRPGTEDIICASPAFERNDLNRLISLIGKKANEKKRILFLDIGADFGSYSLTLGLWFKNYKNFDIFAFEPTDISFELLMRNIRENKLEKKIRTFNIALAEKNDNFKIYYDNERPGSSSIKTKKGKGIVVKGKTMDSLGIRYNSYDAIFVKIDVEGFEDNVIKGSKKLLETEAELYLFIEDFKNTRFIKHLSQNIIFDTKITPYNSWWRNKADI